MNFLKEVLIKNRLKIFFYISLYSLIQSCSYTQLGKRLADSFDSPLEQDIPSEKIEKSRTKDSPLVIENNKMLTGKSNKKSILLEQELVSQNNQKSSLPIDKKKFKASYGTPKSLKAKPYRIIIRLYEVDPAAPAEIVTSALKNAGVIYEVEKIERFENEKPLKNLSVR